jgi:FkbM family methyltransferase
MPESGARPGQGNLFTRRLLESLGYPEHTILTGPPRLHLRGPAQDAAVSGFRAPSILDRIGALRTTFGETLENIRAPGHRPGTVNDVGVTFGTPELYGAFPDSDLVMIEPLTEFQPHMEKVAAAGPGSRFIVAAAGREDGEMEMSVMPDKSTSSLQVFAGAERRKIPVVRVDSQCRKWNATPPYDLKVGVQGAELVVMDGASGILAEALVAVLETSFWGNSEVPDLTEVIAYLKQRGFAVYDIVGGHNRPRDWARARADVVFVQVEGPLRADRRRCAPKQRAEFLNAKRARASFRKVMGRS